MGLDWYAFMRIFQEIPSDTFATKPQPVDMLTLIKRLLKSGIRGDENTLVFQRMKLVNALTLAIQLFAFSLLVIVLFYGLYVQALIGGVTIILLSLTYWLNARGMYPQSAYYMVNFTSLGILFASYQAYSTSVFAETENWLFAFLVIAVFLFDGWLMLVQFAILFAEICVSKYVKYQMFGLEMGRDFDLLIINSIVLSLGIYLALVIVKESLRRALNRLNDADIAKTKLLSLLAHDLKNPISTFESLLDVGETDKLSKEEFKMVQSGIKARFQPIKESIHGLLDWSMAQLKNSDPVISNFDVGAAVRLAEKSLDPMCAEKGIRVVSLGEATEVQMDHDHFNIILRNMLHNAVKFSPREGEINVSWQSNGKFVKLSVEDKGVGLSSNQIKTILTGKIVKSNRGTEGEKGTGLGLNLSLELLKKNLGAMEIESTESSTIFTIQVPK